MAKINYSTLKEIKCKYCKVQFKPTGPAQNHCPECEKHLNNIEGQVARDVARMKKFGTYELIGKGNTQPSGEEHPQYKTGLGYFRKRSKEIRRELVYCNRCGKDVLSSKDYAVHHIDHDRTNNVDSNFELLCKRCHQIHHKCYDNFTVKAQRLSRKGVPSSEGKRPAQMI